MTDQTIPNALPLNAEAVGRRIRLNKGSAPTTFWMLQSFCSDLAWDEQGEPTCYTSRELAVEDVIELQQELAGEDEQADMEEAQKLIAALQQKLLDTGEITEDETYDGMTYTLREVALWGSRA